MTAQVYPSSAWYLARSARASAGKAPRLAVIRAIVIRERPDRGWCVEMVERRYGVWKKPEWLCVGTTLDEAKTVAEKAWRKHRLPIALVPPGGRHMRPFHINRPVPIGGAA
jgi:hypothetical protein